MAHDHAHDHGHDHEAGHGHRHDYKRVTMQRLRLSLAITTVVMFIEAVGGWLAGSIALVGDAGHMLTHAFAISVSMFGIYVARQPRCHHKTFGMLRAEVLAAFVNGLFLLAVCAGIVVESIHRFLDPRPILTLQMLVIAVLGLVVNLVSILLLHESRHKDLNVRSVFMHMVGDAASSVAIVAAAIVIRYTQWTWVDPALGIAISLWICVWAGGLLKESCRVLLEMAPRGRDVHQVTRALRERFPEVVDTHSEHLWTITEEVVVFSAHLRVNPAAVRHATVNDWLDEVEHWLEQTFELAEVTLQLRFEEGGPPTEA